MKIIKKYFQELFLFFFFFVEMSTFKRNTYHMFIILPVRVFTYNVMEINNLTFKFYLNY